MRANCGGVPVAEEETILSIFPNCRRAKFKARSSGLVVGTEVEVVLLELVHVALELVTASPNVCPRLMNAERAG